MTKVYPEGPKGRERVGYNSEENNTKIPLGVSDYGLEKGFGKEARRLLGRQGSPDTDKWVHDLTGRGQRKALFSSPHRHHGGLCLWEKRGVRVGFR